MIATQLNSLIVSNPPAITSGPLPPMYVGQAFTHTFTATGAAPMGQWFVAATNPDNSPSELPAGLTLNPVTGELFGTPTTAGPCAFTVGIPDANG